MNTATVSTRSRAGSLRGWALVLALATSGCNIAESDVGLDRQDSLATLTSSPILADIEPSLDEPPAEPEVPAEQEASTPRIAGDERLSLQLRGTALAEAIHMIAEHAGINVYLDASLDGLIDANFPDVTLDAALGAILQRNGLALVEAPPGVYAVRVQDGSQPATGRFVLQSIHAADVSEQIKELVGETSRVVIDANQNLVVVHGTQADVDLVAQYLELADRLKAQVLIEVNIFEARLDESFEFGASFELDSTVDGDAYSLIQNLSTPSNAFSLTFEGTNLASTLNTVRRYVGLELVSSPRVLAVTNTESMIEVIRQIPYINVTSTTETDAGGFSVLEQVEFQEAGIKLTVTPTVQERGVLQVKVDQSLSEVVAVFNGIPVLNTRQLTSQFLVADQRTIVLGGLMQERSNDVDEGVPVLMHIPILGRLFRKDEDVSEQSELLIFLTPRILDPREAAQVAKSYQRHYGTKRQEMIEAVRAD